MQGNEQNGYPQNQYQQNGNPQNVNPYAYQQNFNGFNRGGSFSAGVGNVSDAFSEAREAMKQKVVAQSFIFMVAALVITAIGAYVASAALENWLRENSAGLIILFVAEIAVVIASNIALKKNNVVLSSVLLTIYSFVNGATLGIVCSIYVQSSVVRVFAICAVMFLVTAFYGLVTKKDLSSLGSLCIMGLIGLILVGVVNLFLKSDGLNFLTSIIGVAVFVGLTAYDTRKVKESAAFADESNTTALAINGAFELYLDFINLFLYLLRLFGKRR